MQRILQAIVPRRRREDEEEQKGWAWPLLQALTSFIIRDNDHDENKKSILEILPLELMLLIAAHLSPLDAVRLGLTCQTLWTLIGAPTARKHRTLLCRPFQYEQLDAWQMALREVFAMRDGRRQIRPAFEQPRWQLLRTLEREAGQRWLCCSGCQMLHPREEFCALERWFVLAEQRECRLGRTGVVHLCQCVQLTYRDAVRLVQELWSSRRVAAGGGPGSDDHHDHDHDHDHEGTSQDDIIIENGPNNFLIPGRPPWHHCTFRDPGGICQIERTIYLSVAYETTSGSNSNSNNNNNNSNSSNQYRGPFLYIDIILHVSLFRYHRLVDLGETEERARPLIVPLCPHRNLFRFLDDIEQITFGVPWESNRRNPGGSLFSVACDFCPSVFTMLAVQHFARLHRPRPYPEDPFQFTMMVARALNVGPLEGSNEWRRCPELFYAHTDARYERVSTQRRWEMDPNKPWVSWGVTDLDDLFM
ncbi:hypothetical protein VTN31DRAFT_63 [Thermomyces dupontii]|uniref:uncharacterized protein n=1 Tax=Talaromyces thermophilus TaxID=28565 RepID=UPI003744ACD9